jgi:hypothetical protein
MADFEEHHKVCGVNMSRAQRDLVIIAMVSVIVQVMANLYLKYENADSKAIAWAFGYIVLALFLNITYYKTFI